MLIDANEALAEIIQNNCLPMDATFFLPTSGRDAKAEYLENRIAGAAFFDINQVADEVSNLPHTMPTADIFEYHMRTLGLNTDQKVLLYDQSGMLSSARAWWMLRHFGHKNVAILDGGLKAWIAAGGPVDTGLAVSNKTGNFIANPPNKAAIKSLEDMKTLVATPLSIRPEQIVDARSAERFSGKAPEPRPGMASGHMPGAISCPISLLLDNKSGKLKSITDIRSVFLETGIDMNSPIVTSCGSGVTACGLAFGMALLGKTDVSIYDGSWSEWGSPNVDRQNCPVVTE